MALTAYCKKCAREVDPGEVCPFCGTKLGKNAAHAVWCVERTPVKDWMNWNELMRILLPAALVILLLVLLAEGIAGGISAVEKMLVSGFPMVLLILLGTILVMAFAVLLLQGKELTDYTVDSRGVHEVHYLPDPSPVKLITRLKSPSLMKHMEQGDAGEEVPAVQNIELFRRKSTAQTAENEDDTARGKAQYVVLSGFGQRAATPFFKYDLI